MGDQVLLDEYGFPLGLVVRMSCPSSLALSCKWGEVIVDMMR